MPENHEQVNDVETRVAVLEQAHMTTSAALKQIDEKIDKVRDLLAGFAGHQHQLATVERDINRAFDELRLARAAFDASLKSLTDAASRWQAEDYNVFKSDIREKVGYVKGIGAVVALLFGVVVTGASGLFAWHSTQLSSRIDAHDQLINANSAGRQAFEQQLKSIERRQDVIDQRDALRSR